VFGVYEDVDHVVDEYHNALVRSGEDCCRLDVVVCLENTENKWYR